MAELRTRLHPLWPSGAALGGLAATFLAERLLGDAGTPAMVSAVLGLGLVLIAAGARGVLLARAPHPRRAVARLLFVATAGLVLALALLAGADAVEPASRRGSLGLAGLGWLTLLASLLPLLAVEASTWGVARNPGYEDRRVRSATGRALGFALLLGALFFGNFLASEHPVKGDWAQASAVRPSEATLTIARGLTEPVEILLFYPRASEVAESLRRYFDVLVAANPRLSVERIDHALAFERAEQAKVRDNGTIALVQGSASETIRVPDQPRSARSALRRLDRSVLGALMKLGLSGRVAYYTTGHGERPMKERDGEDARPPMSLLRRQLSSWQFEPRPLGLAQGLADAVPEDAGLVLILDPQEDFLPAEEEALIRAFEDHEARILLLLEDEPRGLDRLLARMGLALGPGPLANDRAFAPLTRTKADHGAIWSNRFSSHPSVSTMTRDERLAVVFRGPTALESPTSTLAGVQPRLVLDAVDGTYVDENRNFDFDSGETTESFGLAAAVTRTATSGPRVESRAFVMGDADVLADELLPLNRPNLYLLADVVRWLQLDDAPVAPTVEEKDVKIVHKSDEDALLFYGSTFGVPALVLVAGAFATRRRRR